jgi:tetratricopeptide (TPR) repeat protein
MNDEYREFSALMKRSAFTQAASFAERQLVAVGDKSEFWLTQLSNALRESGNAKGALAAADKASILSPRNAWALLARAEALVKLGRLGEALPLFEEALVDARAAQRARWGRLSALTLLKQWDRVITECASPTLPAATARPFRVKALHGLGRLDEAIAECESWLSENSDSRQALWQMAELRIARDGLDVVLANMGRLAKIPGKPAVYGEIYASLCKRAGNSAKAADQYARLSQGNSSPDLLRKQAFALAKSGREAEALPIMEELLRLDPKDMYLHAAYTPACKRKGSLDRAHGFYAELIILHPEEKSLYGRIKRLDREIAEAGGDTDPRGGLS